MNRKCYVRFHYLNPKGLSYNYRDRHWEKGISVYEAICTDNEYHLIIPDKPSAAQTLISIIWNVIQSKQPIFEISADVLLKEVGSDGEPLLLGIHIEKELCLELGRIVPKQKT
jgi:hypothetical protein